MINYIRLAAGLDRFISQPLPLTDCWELIRRRVEDREENFLTLLQQFVYPNPRSPYRKLLQHARCEFEDVKVMLHREGLEPTLQKLSELGVYITIEEYRGQKPVERNGLSFEITPGDFDRRDASWVLQHVSGGTRSEGICHQMTFDLLTEEAATEGVLFDELALHGFPYVFCVDNLPRLLETAKIGIFPEKWFFPTSTNKNKLASYYAVAAARLLGQPLPWPERIGLRDVERIARWLAERLKAVPRIAVRSTVSTAIRICQAAENGLNISGTHFLVGSEPLSPAREREILARGCTVTPLYGATEIGVIARGCANTTSDEMHLFRGHVGVILEARPVGSTGTMVDALRFTSLLTTAPKILINAENGDFARLEKAKCGCKFDSVGLTDQLSHVRSFEKLTSDGMTFFAGEVARVVEEVLPTTFGGGPLDYQAIEEEGEDGISYLALLVSPRLTSVKEREVIDVFIRELRKGGSKNRRMADSWQEVGAIRIFRRDPEPTRGGKVFPFQVR